MLKLKVLSVLFAALVAAPVFAQQVSPSTMLDSKDIRLTGDALLKQAKASPDGLAFKMLFTRPDGNEQITVRVKSGQGEWHRDYADVLMVLSGHAEIITGGKVINGKQTAPGEIRGDGVQGGKKESFNAGDVIRIEPQVAHQVILSPGSDFRYFVVKVKTSR